MARLSVAPRAKDDAKFATFLDEYERRVEAMPPGMCAVAMQLDLLRAGGCQTCGKCVPCRDGLPQLASMLRHLVDCQADAAEVERMRALAEMVRDTSDCAIGYESANALLEGLDAFAAEVESHVSKHECQRSVGQSVPCETFCPAHVNVPAYIALVAQGDYAGAAAEYERVLGSDPSDALAARERAKALLLARSGAADVRDVRAAAAAAPDDVEAQLAVADIDMIGGQIQDAFDRLLDFLAAGHKADIEQVRKRLLEYFAIPEPTDPRLTRARRRLATLMY